MFKISISSGNIAFYADCFSELELKYFQIQLRRAKECIIEKTHKGSSGKSLSYNGSIADEIKKYIDLLASRAIT